MKRAVNYGAMTCELLLLSLAISMTVGTAHASAPSYRFHASIEAPECGGGYNIEQANVVILDGHNRIRASAMTSKDQYNSANVIQMPCMVKLTVTVPKLPFYHIRIGGHDGPTYTFGELQKDHWRVKLNFK